MYKITATPCQGYQASRLDEVLTLIKNTDRPIATRISTATAILLPDEHLQQLKAQIQAGAFKHVILAVHGPSAAGKSRLAKQLERMLGKDQCEIISRDARIKEHLSLFNRMTHRAIPNLTLSEFHALHGKGKSPLSDRVNAHFKQVDEEMVEYTKLAHKEGKVVIYDTMQRLPQDLLSPDTLVVRIIVRCLDTFNDRDWPQLAKRHQMPVAQQKMLASLTFEEFDLSSQAQGALTGPHFNAVCAWHSDGPRFEPCVATAIELTREILRLAKK